jgi:hypothetical protein
MIRKASFQRTLASQRSFEKHGRKSKRELFLDQMEEAVPWSELLALVSPHYPKTGNGRQPVGLPIMLRTYFLQQWFNLSTCLTLGWKRRSMSPPFCAVSPEWIWVEPRRRMRRRFFVFAIFWKSTRWEERS